MVSLYFRHLDYSDAEEIKHDPNAYGRKMKKSFNYAFVGFVIIIFILICAMVYCKSNEWLSEFVVVTLSLSDFVFLGYYVNSAGVFS